MGKRMFRCSVSLILALSLFGSGLSAAAKDPVTPELLKLLAAGEQRKAETLLSGAAGSTPEVVFWTGLLSRTRFDVKGALPLLVASAQMRPDSPESRAALCVVGLDLARDGRTALLYYNALLTVASQNPRSVPIRWMAAMMARTLTRTDAFHLSAETKKRILRCGVREYEAVLSLLRHGPGPALVHQTVGNLLDDLEAYEESIKHRNLVLGMERKPWSLQASAWTLHRLGRDAEALPLIREAIAASPEDPTYHRTLGDILWTSGQRAEAAQAYEAASKLSPKDRTYLWLSMYAQRQLGNYTAAREFARRRLADAPDDAEFKVWEARFSVLLQEPGASERLLEAGGFDFRGNPIKLNPAKGPWFLAAQTGDLQKFQQLMATEDINAGNPDESGKTALMYAAQAGWEPILVELIRAGADLDRIDSNGDTALHHSADFAQPRMMQLLLEAGAKTGLQDRWKQTPLTMAACERDWDAFRALLQKTPELHLATPHGTPLHYACGYGEIGMIRALLQKGADINARSPRLGMTPLMTACKQWAHSYVVTPLLDAGAEINARDFDGRTALHHSIDPLMNVPLVELLLEKGADPSIPDRFGTTAILQARLLGFEETARAMENKIGRRETLRFPRLQVDEVSREQRNALFFVFPILLGEGHPLGRLSSAAPNDKAAAREELERMFDIDNADALRQELRAFEKFEPTPPASKIERLGPLLTETLGQIRLSAVSRGEDESAWVKAHLIYLSDLGMIAGFLEPGEAAERIGAASREISAAFSSWEDFLRSFQLGVRLYEGWEADRYKQIGRNVQAHVIWPR